MANTVSKHIWKDRQADKPTETGQIARRTNEEQDWKTFRECLIRIVKVTFDNQLVFFLLIL